MISSSRTAVIGSSAKPKAGDDRRRKSMTEFALHCSSSEERVLLRELNHRINNEFASIINMVTLAAVRCENEEAKAALDGVTERLHQYVDVHRALKMPQHAARLDAAAHLRRLCQSISGSKLDRMKIKLVLEASQLTLSSDRCWRLGMIVYELITNAARHAFSGREGEIRVELSRAGSLIQCRVLDNGSGAPTFQPGQGTKIVRHLAEELGGHIEHHFGPRGSMAILVFPSSSKSRAAARRASEHRRNAPGVHSRGEPKRGPGSLPGADQTRHGSSKLSGLAKY
jgi:two-component sensor histidine kinase